MGFKREHTQSTKEIDKWPTYPAPPTGKQAGGQLLLGMAYLTTAAVLIAFLVETPEMPLHTKLTVLILFFLFALNTYFYNRYFQKFWQRLVVLLAQIAIVTGATLIGKDPGTLSILYFVLIPMMYLAFNFVPASLLVLLSLFAMFFSNMAIFDFENALSNILPYGGGFAFFAASSMALVEQQKEKQRAEKLLLELEEAHQQLSAYAIKIEALAVAEERNRIARDIHDSLGHYLTAMTMQLQAAEKLVETDPKRTAATITKVEKMARTCLAEVRRAVATLRTSPVNETSLNEAVKELVDNFNNDDVDASLVVEGEPLPLSMPVKTAIYRTVQEGLTNVAKHTKASMVEVKLLYEQKKINLSIVDNGVGRVDDLTVGFGLIGLRERVTVLGGAFDAGNLKEGGFKLSVSLPPQVDIDFGKLDND